MQLSTSQQLVAILPLIATVLSGWLSQDRLPRAANALIALIALIGTALLCAFLAGNFTGNAQASLLAVLGYVALLMNGDLRVLYQFLVALPGPLAALAPVPTPAAKTPPGPQAIAYPASQQQPPPSFGG